MDSVSGPWKGHFQLLFASAALCVCGWGCEQEREGQIGSVMFVFVYHCSTMQLVRQVAFFLLLCFVPIHQCRPIFCHTECKYRTSFQRDVLYSLESRTKEIIHWQQSDFSSRALLLFRLRETWWPARSVSRATLVLLSAWATKDKATVWLITSNVNMHTYLSCRSLANSKGIN